MQEFTESFPPPPDGLSFSWRQGCMGRERGEGWSQRVAVSLPPPSLVWANMPGHGAADNWLCKINGC